MSSFDRQSHKRSDLDEVSLSEHPTIVTVSKLRVRSDLAFAEMAARHEDTLLDDVSLTDWDQCEWQWSSIFIE
jgi:antitoxin MazE